MKIPKRFIRLGIFLNIVYCLVATVQYIRLLGVDFNSKIALNWEHVWMIIFPFYGEINPYSNYAPRAFDFLGYLTLLGYPSILMWALAYGFAWVLEEFNNNESTEK